MNLKKSIPKRSYNQKARAEAAAETRRRIIDVTREQLTRAPLENVGLPLVYRGLRRAERRARASRRR